MKNHRTPDEWRKLFDAQQQSGLNQTQFCKRHKLTRSAFFNAKKRLALDPTPQDNPLPPAFIAVSPEFGLPHPWVPNPVEPIPAVAEPASPPLESIRLTLPHCSLQLPASLSPHWLATLLQELAP
nr:hypothetical protein 49p1_00234 [Yersinia frederiksenii]